MTEDTLFEFAVGTGRRHAPSLLLLKESSDCRFIEAPGIVQASPGNRKIAAIHPF
jgi:hypothetical protein